MQRLEWDIGDDELKQNVVCLTGHTTLLTLQAEHRVVCCWRYIGETPLGSITIHRQQHAHRQYRINSLLAVVIGSAAIRMDSRCKLLASIGVHNYINASDVVIGFPLCNSEERGLGCCSSHNNGCFMPKIKEGDVEMSIHYNSGYKTWTH